LRQLGLAVLVVLVAATACADGRRDFEASTASVLVPTDERFLSQWFFTVDDGPNNYTARAHWDPSFNPDIDRSLTVESYQINELDSWTGEGPAETDLGAQAFVNAITDARTDQPACEQVSVEPVIHECEYDEGRVEPIRLQVRSFDEATMLVFGDSPAALDYIAGEFRTLDPLAAAQWFES